MMVCGVVWCAVAGARAAALRRARDPEIADAKRRYLDASRADGRGGSSSPGVRGWFVFMIYGLSVSPIPPRHVRDEHQLDDEDESLEDFAVWYSVTQPSGRFCSRESIGKYCSAIRAFLSRVLRRPFGRGAAASIIPDLLMGYERLVQHPPPRERDGCTPYDLVVGMMALGVSQAWRSALTSAMVGLMRGVEFALDSSRHEVFEESEHMTANDVTMIDRGGARHARVKMRKRKDLRVLRGKHDVVVLAGGGGGLFDAVAELEAWLAERRRLGIPDSRPLFCHPDGASFTVAQVRDMVKAVMRAAGRDPSMYGAHSLRIGGATAALAAGVSPQLIRLMGRWSSDVYQIYCRMSLESALGVGQAISSAVVTSVGRGFHEEHLELQPEEVAEIRDEFAGAAWAVEE